MHKAALRKEIEKPAGERRDAAAVVNEVMEDWIFTTPERRTARTKLDERVAPKAGQEAANA